MGELFPSEFIVLKKIPYRESSLIVSGLTPLYGKADFVVRGARSSSRKKFPHVDLFRVIQLEIDPHKEGLQPLYKTELIRDFDRVAEDTPSFMEACSLASFILKNSHSMMKSEMLYTAFTLFLQRSPVKHGQMLVKLVYLHENGLLPEKLSNASGDSGKRQKELLEGLLKAALGDGEIPHFNESYWKKLDEWISGLCAYHDLKQ